MKRKLGDLLIGALEHVNERFNRTLEDRFIALGNMTADCEAFNQKLINRLIEYNLWRPHQFLGYEVPVEYHYRYQKVSPMYPSSTADTCGVLSVVE